MVLLLTQGDLRPLLGDSASMEGAFEAIEAGHREYEEGKVPTFSTMEVSVTGAQRSLRLKVGASPAIGWVGGPLSGGG